MVKQGAPDEEKRWTVPSGGLEPGETPKECAVREVREETGFEVRVTEKLFDKRGESFGRRVLVHYFRAELAGGRLNIRDPDGFVHEVAWIGEEELETLPLAFPEDRPFLLDVARKAGIRHGHGSPGHTFTEKEREKRAEQG